MGMLKLIVFYGRVELTNLVARHPHNAALGRAQTGEHHTDILHGTLGTANQQPIPFCKRPSEQQRSS